jgi:hypothetical protein
VLYPCSALPLSIWVGTLVQEGGEEGGEESGEEEEEEGDDASDVSSLSDGERGRAVKRLTRRFLASKPSKDSRKGGKAHRNKRVDL